MKFDLKKRYVIMNNYEKKLRKKGFLNIVGIDEVGRGPLAGPVVVAGVVLDEDYEILGLFDSKKLSRKKREFLSEEIKKKSKAYAISSVSSSVIDKIGINPSTELAVNRTIEKLQKVLDINYLLIDQMSYNNEEIYNQKIVKGDQLSNSIAAASIIAKVFRDRYMVKKSYLYPEYDFQNNFGYGTKKHVQAINKFGIIDKLHRKSFEPIKSILNE